MAYTTVNKSTDYFNTKLYTGNGVSGTGITGVGFKPDWLWTKERSSTSSHTSTDIVRGANVSLNQNADGAQATETQSIISFDSDGFTVGSGGGVNQNSETYVGWSWLAGGNQGSSNTDGDITSTVSANTTSGFSIVKYTGNGSASNIGHGLGSALKTIIIKKTSGSADWLVGHNSLHSTLPWKYGINLNNTDARHESGSYFADTAPTASVFRVEANDEVNTSGQTYIAYCFAEKKGFSKFGSYTGNGNNDGSFIYTGYAPAFIMIKRTDSAGGWYMFDSKRPGYNPNASRLLANGTDTDAGTGYLDINSNGFKLRHNAADYNGSGNSYIYMAFAEAPLVGSNNVPANAR